MSLSTTPPAIRCSPTASTRATAAPDSAAKILDVTADLVAGHGCHGTAISMITAAVGLPASSIYWHFGSKDGLLAAVVERAATDLVRAFAATTDQQADRRVARIIAAAALEMRDNPSVVATLTELRALLRLLARPRGQAADADAWLHAQLLAALGFDT